MPRLTITLSEERQRAVKEAAARRGTTITATIDESLELAGIRTRESAQQIVARARQLQTQRPAGHVSGVARDCC